MTEQQHHSPDLLPPHPDFTGVVYGTTIRDRRTGKHWRQIAEYINGECTDRYVTRAPAK